jgi:hypothetical protein
MICRLLLKIIGINTLKFKITLRTSMPKIGCACQKIPTFRFQAIYFQGIKNCGYFSEKMQKHYS